jgi:hypothetical protein
MCASEVAHNAELVRIVNEQAEDPNLWRIDGGSVPVTLHEELLQAALRRLHRVIEGGIDSDDDPCFHPTCPQSVCRAFHWGEFDVR